MSQNFHGFFAASLPQILLHAEETLGNKQPIKQPLHTHPGTASSGSKGKSTTRAPAVVGHTRQRASSPELRALPSRPYRAAPYPTA